MSSSHHIGKDAAGESRRVPEWLAGMLQEVGEDERTGLISAWECAGDAPEVDPAIRAAVWTGVQAAVAPPLARRVSRTERPARRAFPLRLVRLPLLRPMAVAASLLLFASVAYLTRPVESVYMAGTGQTAQVLLGDGTTVELAPGSTLRHGEDFFGETRTVSLRGEAFFDVTPASENEGRAFAVHTPNARIDVVGTAFGVRARGGEAGLATQVVVAHGAVRVASSTIPGAPVLLAPGQGSRVQDDARPTAPEAVGLERALAWRSGGLAFDNAPMGDVFDEMERRFGIAIDAPEAIRRINVSYWRETLLPPHEMLADLAALVDAGVRKTANGFDVFHSER